MPTDVIDPLESDQLIADDLEQPEQQVAGDDESADAVGAESGAGDESDSGPLSDEQLRSAAGEIGVSVEGSRDDLEQAILSADDQSEGQVDARMNELTQLAESYGIDAASVGQLKTPEALEQVLLLYEREFRKEGEQQLSEPASQQQRQVAQPKQADPAGKPFELDWGEEEVSQDDIYVKNMQGLRGETQRLQEQIEQMQTQIVQQQEMEINQHAQAEMQRFDDIVDGLDAELFGGNKKTLSDAEVSNRRTLWESAKTIQEGAYQRGRDVELSLPFLNQAKHHAFADQLQQSERKRLFARVRKQSRRRTGSGNPRGSVASDQSAEDREMDELFESFAIANGDARS
jgi:hypothetical protein